MGYEACSITGFLRARTSPPHPAEFPGIAPNKFRVASVVGDNTVTWLTITGSAAFVRHAAPNTACGAQTGGSIISGNRFLTSLVIKWYVDNSVDVNPSTATNNSDSNGMRSGA